MTTLRQAVELTISAIEEGVSFDHLDNVTAPMLRRALAESEQEHCGYDETTGLCTRNPCCYTAPPQRKPLTEEEIWNLLPDDNTPMSLGEAFLKFARLIEAAHGIKVDA